MNALIVLSIVIAASMIGGFIGVFIGRLVISHFCKKGKKINLYRDFFDDLEEVVCEARANANHQLEMWEGRESNSDYQYAKELIETCNKLAKLIEEARA